MLDSRKKANPTAKLTKVLAVRRRLYRRLMAIQAIEPNLHRWRQSFLSLIREAERLFREATAYLAPLIARLDKMAVARRLSDKTRERVSIRLKDYADELERLDIRPFLSPCRRMANELRMGARYISNGCYYAARLALRRAYESLKLREIRSDIERFISYLTKQLYRPDGIIPAGDLSRISNGLRNLQKRIGNVNEYLFVHPVCSQTAAYLKEAITIVKRFTLNSRARELTELKALLKVIAYML